MNHQTPEARKLVEEAERHGLRRNDIKPCAVCGHGIAHNQNLMSYRVTIEHHLLNSRNVQETAGLEMMMGNVALATVMGPDLPITARVSTRTVLLCQDCAHRKMGAILELDDPDEEAAK
jgi:hypothetical protein